MAITKIISINSVEKGNPAEHLKAAISYIQNGDKTEEGVLVGSINCLPETAFEQMLDTKKLFGKTGKREGYHIIISLVPGEGTAEVAFDIIRRFAEEFLKDEYEAVYSVHTDKGHIHAHLVWNSVSLVTGKKYEYKKGDWKYKIQPITNRLCEEYGLEIMPAEYSKNPKNMNREEWEREQSVREFILRDANYCVTLAGDLGHFKFLLGRLGYDVKEEQGILVRVPGMKKFHRLDSLSENFKEALLEGVIRYSSCGIPNYQTVNPWYMKRAGLAPIQKDFYQKMYRLRVIEKKRFMVGSAEFMGELRKFHKLQDEYLMLCDNDIRSYGDLFSCRDKQSNRLEEIGERQKELYKERFVKKRVCRSEEDVRGFQIWLREYYRECDELKGEKKQVKEQLRLLQGCLDENLGVGLDAVLELEELGRDHDVEVPEYVENNHGEMMVQSVEGITDKKSILLPDSYEEYCSLSVEEKAQGFQFDMDGSLKDASYVVKEYLDGMKVKLNLGDLWNETQVVWEKAIEMQSRDIVEKAIEEILVDMDEKGVNEANYESLSVREKVNLFDFGRFEAKRAIKIYSVVLNRMKIVVSYEEFQSIYDVAIRKNDKERCAEREKRK